MPFVSKTKTGDLALNTGASIRLRPATFHRVPFDRLKPWCTLGTVRRIIGREPGRVLVEIELDGYVGICWEHELSTVEDCA